MNRTLGMAAALAAVVWAALAAAMCGGCDRRTPDAAPRATAPASAGPASGDTAGRDTAGGDTSGGDRAAWPETVRFGLVPSEGGADTSARYRPLRDVLERTLGRRVELITASSYQGVITAMGNDQLEFAYFGPKSYVEAARRAKAEAMLVELNTAGERGYRCVFVVAPDSPINTLADARGKRFAFTDPNSTSGHLIPSVIIRDMLKMSAKEFFGSVVYSGSHASSMLQVINGEVDIAATNDLDMQSATARGAIRPGSLRVVHTSDLIPGSLIAVRRGVPESLKTAVAEALTTLNADPAALEHLQNGGYAPVTDAEYDLIRAAEDLLTRDAAPARGAAAP